MASQHTIDGSKTEREQTPDAAAEDSAADLATLTVKQPLKVLNDDLGSDPYNHTGRFSAPTED